MRAATSLIITTTCVRDSDAPSAALKVLMDPRRSSVRPRGPEGKVGAHVIKRTPGMNPGQESMAPTTTQNRILRTSGASEGKPFGSPRVAKTLSRPRGGWGKSYLKGPGRLRPTHEAG